MNKLVCALVLFCLSACVAAQWTDSTWTDNEYGGVMYLCFEGSDVSGSYSQYGLVRGERDGSQVTGNWYEVGNGDCTSGSFVWNLASNGQSFSGYWTCDGEDNRAYDWNSNRLGGSATTNDVTCAKLRPAPVSGTWFDGNYKVDLCVAGDEYKSSYIVPNRARGYEEGVSHRNGVIATGQYTMSDGQQGLSLFFHMRDGRLGNFYWGFDDLDLIDTREDFYNADLHGFDILTREGETTAAECVANRYLLEAQPFVEEETFNSASSLVASFVACVMAALAFF